MFTGKKPYEKAKKGREASMLRPLCSEGTHILGTGNWDCRFLCICRTTRHRLLQSVVFLLLFLSVLYTLNWSRW